MTSRPKIVVGRRSTPVPANPPATAKANHPTSAASDRVIQEDKPIVSAAPPPPAPPWSEGPLDYLCRRADLRAVIEGCTAQRGALVEGVWNTGAAPVLATLMRQRPAAWLIVVPQISDFDSTGRDLEVLVGRSVEFFPPEADDREADELLQREVVQRLQVLGRLESFNAQTAGRGGPSSVSPSASEPPIIVTTLAALMHPVPSPQSIRARRRLVEVGQVQSLTEMRQWLLEAGYHTTTSVQLAGEFTFRGGILDVFPPDMPDPIRVEWFDDTVESIRRFDSMTQKSIERLDSLALAPAKGETQETATLLDYLPVRAMVAIHEPTPCRHLARAYLDRIPFPERFLPADQVWGDLIARPHVYLAQLIEPEIADREPDLQRCRTPIGDVQRIGGELETLGQQIDQAIGENRQAIVLCWNEGEQSRMRELLAASQANQQGRVRLELGSLSSGFEALPDGPWVLTVNQLLKRHAIRRGARKISSRAIDSFLELRPGDLVVHLSHGIGIYRGLQLLEKLGQKHEHLEIEFDEGTKLFVPTSKIDLIQRYIGGTKSQPKLAKIGGQAWVRQKRAAEQAVTDMASELLELQAQRRARQGIAFASDSAWQHQFDTSFPYSETADQLTAIASTKSDMQSLRPMDRLICGDVGFGKTEVAMRAAFKAVESGYQVAVLVPTTVLAEQHYQTFRERMAEFPFDVARLSRFCTAAEQKEILGRLAKGQIDIIIGTHRLASADVQFFNLGLVIIDEEQRFGVSVKERLKQQQPNVDLLTLSATPIPRTLHMSLVGVRDISNLETPPEERMAVETRVVRFEDRLVRNAILRELNREGQIYFVHNRIQDMPELAARLQRLVPEVRLVIGHGQMPEHQLEQVMIDFIEHRYDLLLSTTIIESGLDIPNANTIFIDAADRYGLAELHQLRGRVGRYKHQAYCYLLVDRHKHLNPEAARRMHAIEEFSHIGAGFGIAMRDLEIRGAGNLLGTQQSGHIAAVGYELYCQLLESAVRRLKREPPKLSIDVEVQLPIEGFLPADYVPEMRHKIDLYRRLSRVNDVGQLDELRQELVDRFGPVPPQVERLLQVAELRIDATLWSIKTIGLEDEFMVFAFGDRRRIEQLARRHGDRLRVLDGDRAYWPLGERPGDLLELARSILR